jgi:predicted dehydrogenase
MRKSLIVGMGIGNLYNTVLTNLEHMVITVDADPAKGADFLSVEDALKNCTYFDTVHICTPNFTHEPIARQVAEYCGIIFIEKPGVKDADAWIKLISDFPKTRFMMVKNNQWRDNIKELQTLTKEAKYIYIDWLNENRVPNPGTWFTTKELAYGGVSRDLIPHLLSLFITLEPEYMSAVETAKVMNQLWTLDEVSDTDYGIVNKDGTYDVDDYCRIKFEHNDRSWEIMANWRQLDEDRREITFVKEDEKSTTIELGLCPEEAYQAMIKEAVERFDDSEFWNRQFLQDVWIHSKIQ